MKVIHGIEDIKKGLAYPLLTIGNFDGVHLGHQKIFRLLVDRSRITNGTSIVLTFQPHPLKVLSPQKAPPQLTTLDQKIELIESLNIDYMICVNFTREFSTIEAEDFVKDILVGRIGVREIFIGANYLFGKGRKGSPELLKTMGKDLGFTVTVVDELRLRGVIVSSSMIRSLIIDGDVEGASGFLGRPYSVDGTVVEGTKRGRNLLHIPTANLETPNELLPKNGVYAVVVRFDSKTYKGAANIGFNPTFKDKRFSFEVHILDFDGDILGKRLRVDFIKRLRDEMRFDDVQALAHQMRRDIEETRRILKDI
jgi:riboflavin kinase/FMN adenylyltransferase